MRSLLSPKSSRDALIRSARIIRRRLAESGAYGMPTVDQTFNFTRLIPLRAFVSISTRRRNKDCRLLRLTQHQQKNKRNHGAPSVYIASTDNRTATASRRCGTC